MCEHPSAGRLHPAVKHPFSTRGLLRFGQEKRNAPKVAGNLGFGAFCYASLRCYGAF